MHVPPSSRNPQHAQTHNMALDENISCTVAPKEPLPRPAYQHKGQNKENADRASGEALERRPIKARCERAPEAALSSGRACLKPGSRMATLSAARRGRATCAAAHHAMDPGSGLPPPRSARLIRMQRSLPLRRRSPLAARTPRRGSLTSLAASRAMSAKTSPKMRRKPKCAHGAAPDGARPALEESSHRDATSPRNPLSRALGSCNAGQTIRGCLPTHRLQRARAASMEDASASSSGAVPDAPGHHHRTRPARAPKKQRRSSLNSADQRILHVLRA